MHKFDRKTFTMKKQNLSIAYYFIGPSYHKSYRWYA